jgi:hypothetical protein
MRRMWNGVIAGAVMICREIKFAADSPLEETGIELLVPLEPRLDK